MNRQLTTLQVAEVLQFNEQHVRKLIRRGDLKASNVGGRHRPEYRVDEGDVEEYLQVRAVTT